MFFTALHSKTGTHPRMTFFRRGVQEDSNHLESATGSKTESKSPGTRSTPTHRSLWVVLTSFLSSFISEKLVMLYSNYQSNLLLATDKGTNVSLENPPFPSPATVNSSEFINNRILQGSPKNSYQNGQFIIRRSQRSLISESTGATRWTPPPEQSWRKPQ